MRPGEAASSVMVAILVLASLFSAAHASSASSTLASATTEVCTPAMTITQTVGSSTQTEVVTLCHTMSSTTIGFTKVVKFPATVNPLLANATYLGPADPEIRVIVKFILKPGAPESPVLAWEEKHGIVPGVTECTGEEYFYNETSGVGETISSTCQLNLMESNVTLGQLETLVQTPLGMYQVPCGAFYANAHDPLVPADVNATLSDILGLSDLSLMHIRVCPGHQSSFWPDALIGFASAVSIVVIVTAIAFRQRKALVTPATI